MGGPSGRVAPGGIAGPGSWIQLKSLNHTVCPGSSDNTEKMFNTFESENEVYTIYYRAK